MKRSFLFISVFFMLNLTDPGMSSVEAQSPGFTMTVTASNTGNGYLYVSRRTNRGWLNLDSTRTGSGPMVLKGRLDAPELLFLRVDESNTGVPVFGENSLIKVITDFKDPRKTTVRGSEIHDEFTRYSSEKEKLSSQRQGLSEEYKKARNSGDQKKMKDLEAMLKELPLKERQYNLDYVKAHPGSHLSPYILRNVMYYSLQLEELTSLVSSLDKSLDRSVYVTDLRERIAVLEKVAVGRKYTDIILPGQDGKPFKLSDHVGGKIILLDFWASWCGPCRAENPNVVGLYRDYHPKGFDIVGVSLDNGKSQWLEAIKKDNLTWHHMSDLKGWNSAGAALYGVTSIPHTVLIDRDGVIIAKNLRGEQLRAKLSQLLD